MSLLRKHTMHKSVGEKFINKGAKNELKKQLMYLKSRLTARILRVTHQDHVFQDKLPLIDAGCVQALRIRGITEVSPNKRINFDIQRSRQRHLLIFSNDKKLDDLLLKALELSEEIDPDTKLIRFARNVHRCLLVPPLR